MRAPKLFVGRKIRQIRNQHGVTQAEFAKGLGISTSYLNQMENNQRHVTAPVLIALAESYSVDIASLSEKESDRLLADLVELMADPSFRGPRPGRQELQFVAQNAPDVARAIIAMHQDLMKTSEQFAELDDAMVRGGATPTPYEEVRDFFHYIDNYVHELDLAGEALAGKLIGHRRNRVAGLADYIERQHRVQVVIGGEGVAQDTMRHYDRTSKVLTLNATYSSATLAFQIAHQIALLEQGVIMDELIAQAGFRTPDAEAICRLGLANYFAGAVTLPYEIFAAAARDLRHDLDLLADQFGTSLEQVAHRLSTLQRPGQKGVPFFFARVDQAGNITKRHSATKLQFARYGSACPLWNAHQAFETPNRINRQLAETPDGVRYLCLAIAVSKRSGGYRDPTRRHALALGCEITHARDLVYADDLDIESAAAFKPIGISCRICERKNCHQRAMPPLKRELIVDPDMREVVPYGFS